MFNWPSILPIFRKALPEARLGLLVFLGDIREVVPQPHTTFGHWAKPHSFSVVISEWSEFW
jgi:hypothetical protein